MPTRPPARSAGSPTGTRRAGGARGGAWGLVPIPAWLLAASPRLPTDLFVLGGRGPILYAPRGSPTARLLARVANGLVLWGAPLDPGRLVASLLGAIARATDPRLGTPEDRGPVAREALRALIAAAAGRETVGDHPAVGRGSTWRSAATAGLVGAAALLTTAPDAGDLARAIIGAERRRPGAGEPVVERSIDGALSAHLVAARLDVGQDDARSFLAALLMRDLPLLDRASPSVRPNEHPLVAATSIRSWIGAPPIVDAVARHHERPDGTGYPRGLRGEELTSLDLVAAAADAVVSALPPGGLAVTPAADVVAVVGFVVGRRFPASIAAVVSEVMAELGGPLALGPASQGLARAEMVRPQAGPVTLSRPVGDRSPRGTGQRPA